MDWSYDLCLRGVLHLLQCMVFSVPAVQHNLDHYKVVRNFELDHFDSSIDFIGNLHIHMQSSLCLQMEIYGALGKPCVGPRLSQGFHGRAI
jgi:hypothetical protein